MREFYRFEIIANVEPGVGTGVLGDVLARVLARWT
jgi:hypothetical protein